MYIVSAMMMLFSAYEFAKTGMHSVEVTVGPSVISLLLF